MNLAEIILNVNAELSPATDLSTIIKRWANRGQKKFLSLANHDFSWTRLKDLTFATVANQGDYSLSPLTNIGRVIILRNLTTPITLKVIGREEFLEQVPNPTLSTGTPQYAYFSGFSPVLNQPTSASVLSLVSTSINDSTQVVKIEGLDANGILVGEEITLTGVAPVPSTLSYSRILTRSLNGFLNGTLTITSNGGTVTVATIGPRERQGQHPVISLYPVPSSVLTFNYDIFMNLPDLVSNNDMSLIPEVYHDAIEDYCLFRGYRHKKDSESAVMSAAGFERTIAQAVADDQGPMRPWVMKDWYAGSPKLVSDLPGMYPDED